MFTIKSLNAGSLMYIVQRIASGEVEEEEKGCKSVSFLNIGSGKRL
jgi:hypothetical protein